MMTDAATQAITRFIGLFEMLVEEARQRPDFAKFQWKQPDKAEDDPGQFTQVNIKALLVPEGFDPELDYQPIPPGIGQLTPEAVYPLIDIPAPLPVVSLPATDIAVQAPPGSGAAPVSPPDADLDPPSPGSVAVVTIQLISMDDNDLLLDGLGADFDSISTLTAVLDIAVQIAAELEGFDLPLTISGTDWTQPVHHVIKAMADGPDLSELPDGTVIFRVEGQATVGVTVNGQTAQEIVDWKDVLPEYLRPDEPDADKGGKKNSDEDDEIAAGDGETIIKTTSGINDTGTVNRPDDHDISKDIPGHDNGAAGLTGNAVLAGANTLINEVAVGSAWIDAPVIVVSGDLTKLDAISQVNLLVEHDRIDGKAVAGSSAGYNVAEIVEKSSGPLATKGDDAPESVSLYRLEGNLIQYNWVKQITYITDFDRAEVTLTASYTSIGLGENTANNTTVLNEIGYAFDVIFVAGDMTDATIVKQTNVLLDSDEVTTGGIGLIDDAGKSLADNLLYNKASLQKTGIDTATKMKDNFAKAAKDLADGMNEVAGDVVDDMMFAGQSALRALQIDGDLIKVNIFEQTNIIGDSDQIALELAKLRDEFEAEVKLVAGSNALINIANVNDIGVDSTIMTAGKVYDDALIHQAELFDTGAVPDGVKMTGLTNEAIAAFISAEMTAAAEDHAQITPTINHDNAANLDVMQSMLG